MVFFVQIGNGALVQVCGMKKAIARAKHLLLKRENRDKVPYLITAHDAAEAHGGWGTKRQLKL